MSTPQTHPSTINWKVTHLLPSGQPVVFSPTRPYLLGGSAPCCDLQLGKSAPWIANLFYIGMEGIEVWPLAQHKETFMGCLLPAVPFPCFDSMVTVSRKSAGKQPNPPTTSATWPVIKIETPSKFAHVLLNQTITTLGSGEPSILRVPNADLAACHLICLWAAPKLIVISAPRVGGASKVQERAISVGEAIQIKSLRIVFKSIKQVDVAVQPPNAPTLGGPLQLEEKFRMHAEKIRAIFSTRKSRHDRRRRQLVFTFSAVISIIAGVFVYWLLSKVVPFI